LFLSLLVESEYLLIQFCCLTSLWFPYIDIEIRSDTSLAEAVQTLSKFKVLSAPVVDVDAPEDASWIDRYIGIVEFPGIVVWLLHQVIVLQKIREATCFCHDQIGLWYLVNYTSCLYSTCLL